jgi:hypothetical protein
MAAVGASAAGAYSQRSRWWSTFPTFGKRALPQGGPYPKAQSGETIQIRCHSFKMAVPFRFDEDSDRAHEANA